MQLLYASRKFFKKIMQIYGLFLNRMPIFGKKTFLLLKLVRGNKFVVSSFFLREDAIGLR